jgi:hypothetical protein
MSGLRNLFRRVRSAFLRTINGRKFTTKNTKDTKKIICRVHSKTCPDEGSAHHQCNKITTKDTKNTKKMLLRVCSDFLRINERISP